MRIAMTFAAASLAMTGAASADLIISEVIDATLSGGNPKFVEITNTGSSSVTFASGGIILQSNASTDLDIDVDLTGVEIAAGQSYVIQSSANGGQTVFEAVYGFAADLYTPAFFSNGDDRYILNLDGVIVDIHGEIDTDGTGTAWEYLDGYAYRLPTAITGNGGVFDISEWFHSGVNGLEDPGFDDQVETALILSLTTPGTHDFVPEPASAALLALGAFALTRRSA
ncbi:MAG: lamin tail domain-containing protein [Phycisphaeraceae bacterium]